MTVLRLGIRSFSYITIKNSTVQSHSAIGILNFVNRKSAFMLERKYSLTVITPNIQLYNLGKIKLVKGENNLPIVKPEDKTRPLVVLLEWMNAKEKHLGKFHDFYQNFGFDILRIRLSPWQLMWPLKGSQVLARDVANFLSLNLNYSPLLIHGFSVGGYLWGEVLVTMTKDIKKYQTIPDRISGQVFDSVVDVEEIPPGFPAALFPKNPFLRTTFEKYIRYHMKTFYNESTKYYIASRSAFTAGLVKAPTLFIFSKKDPISTPYRNNIAKEELSALNLEVYTKCFENSKHVSHYQMYRDEYIAELSAFLEKTGLILPQKIKAKL